VHLHFDGRELLDDHCLNDYGIKSNDSIVSHYHLRGGMDQWFFRICTLLTP
jgi:hypothetical protein